MDETPLLDRDSFGKEFIKKIFLMLFGYMKYSQLTWIILFSGGLFCIAFFFPIFGRTSLNEKLRLIQDIHIDNAVILKTYSWFSLFLYIVGSIIGRLFKVKINLTLKQKIKITTLTFLVGYGTFFGYIFFGLESKISFLSSVFTFIFILAFIEALTIWSLFFCDLMDKIINIWKKI